MSTSKTVGAVPAARTSRHADRRDASGAEVTRAKMSLKGGDTTWKKVELLE